MLRSRPKSHAIAMPPTSVNGTSTGFGQCSVPNSAPDRIAAGHRLSKYPSNRLVKNEFNAICCNRQNARYPRTCVARSGEPARVATSPKRVPSQQIATEASKKQECSSRRRPKIISTPSQRSRRVSPQHNAQLSHTAITHQVAVPPSATSRYTSPQRPRTPALPLNRKFAIHEDSPSICKLVFVVRMPQTDHSQHAHEQLLDLGLS